MKEGYEFSKRAAGPFSFFAYGKDSTVKRKTDLLIPMGKKLYDKKYCIKLAKRIVKQKKIKGMSISEVAWELFAHAYVFYSFRFVPAFLKKGFLMKRIYKSVSDGVDLTDNGDSLIRKIAYRMIWLLPAVPLK